MGVRDSLGLSAGRKRQALHIGSANHDCYPQTTRVVAVGVGVALVLAVVGLPPVSIHEPWHSWGVMGPTCGMTRAVRLLARGDLGGAWSYNPASFALAAFGGLVLGRALWARLTGRWLVLSVSRPARLAAVAVSAVLIALLWWNQQNHAELLR